MFFDRISCIMNDVVGALYLREIVVFRKKVLL